MSGFNTDRSLEKLCTCHKFPSFRDPIPSIFLSFLIGNFGVSIWLLQVFSVLFCLVGCCDRSPACAELVVLCVVPWLKRRGDSHQSLLSLSCASLCILPPTCREGESLFSQITSPSFCMSRIKNAGNKWQNLHIWYSMIDEFHVNKFNRKC